MTTVEDIEKAIEKLGAGEFDRLRAWFEEYPAAPTFLRREHVVLRIAFGQNPD